MQLCTDSLDRYVLSQFLHTRNAGHRILRSVPVLETMMYFLFLVIIAANCKVFKPNMRKVPVFAPQLRNRQQEIVQQSVDIAIQEKRVLISAPTGYGKTAMFSSIITQIAAASLDIPATETTNTTTSIKARKKPTKKTSKSQKTDLSLFKVVVLSPTVELNRQNEKKFKFWTDGSLSSGIYGDSAYNFTANVIFTTYQMFSRDEHLKKSPCVNLLVIDEAHRAPTASYQKVIQHLLEVNPDLIILGLTATPSRADKKLMIKTFPRITAVVKVQEAIDEGVLVKPIFKTMVLKDAQADKRLKAMLYALEQDVSMLDKKNRYANLVDEAATNDAVVTHWKEQAGDRQTVVFCCTIDHCYHVTEAFKAAGVKVGLVHSQMSQPEEVLEAYSQGKIQVIVNVFKLTEGWDDPPTSCVVLLRPSSYVNTWRQMIGRGLRAFPQKNDCVVLDFGMSTLIHLRTPEVTGLDEEVDLPAEEEEEIERRRRRGEEEESDEDEESALLRQLRQVEAGEIEMKDVYSLRPSDDGTMTIIGMDGTTLQQHRLGINETISDYVERMAKEKANLKLEKAMLKLSTTPKSTRTVSTTDYVFKTIHSEHIMVSSPLKQDGHGDKWTPPVFKTRWSFPQCYDDTEVIHHSLPEEEVVTIDGVITTPSIAEHYVLQSYDMATSKSGLAIVTQPYQFNNDWVAVCGGKDEMAVIACGDKHTCLTAAQKWWAEHWDRQYSQILGMDKPYSRPTQPQLNVLTQRNHRHQIDHLMFTKYAASVLISLLVEKYKILDTLDRYDAMAEGVITRRTPWRRRDSW